MSLFIDTSAFYALLVASEDHHTDVLQTTQKILEDGRDLWTTSYVLLETISLLQHRIGLEPVLDFDEKILPLMRVEWVTAQLHGKGLKRLKRESRRRLSLTDCVSIEFMKAKGLDEVLALDGHFHEAGFTLRP